MKLHDTADVLKKNMYVSMINRRAMTLHWNQSLATPRWQWWNCHPQLRSPITKERREAIRYSTVITPTFSSQIDLWPRTTIVLLVALKIVFALVIQNKRTIYKYNKESSWYDLLIFAITLCFFYCFPFIFNLQKYKLHISEHEETKNNDNEIV